MRRYLVYLLAALIACGGSSKPTTTTPPPGGGGGDVVDAGGTGGTGSTQAGATGDDAPLTLWPKVKKGTLPNGLTYYVMDHGRPAGRAFLWLAVNAGSVQEDDDQRGLAHYVEHMAFNGTQRFPEQKLVSYLESIGMAFGAHLNARTSFDETVYQLEVPVDDPKFIDTGFDILRDWAGNVTFDENEVKKEAGVVLEEWRLGRGGEARVFDKQAKVLFKGSRYADRLIIGDPEILKKGATDPKATRAALMRYYKDWYRPDLMAVIAVGDFADVGAIEKQIAQKFGDLKNPANPRPRPPAGVPKADGTRISIETDREIGSQTVQIHNLIPRLPETTANHYRVFLMQQVYSTILNERFASLARRKDSPFKGAGASLSNFTRDIDSFSRGAEVKAGRVEDTLRALLLEVLRVEKHGFTPSELERARALIGRGYMSMADTEQSKMSTEYAEEMTRNFFEGELMIGRVAENALAQRFLPTITLAELNTFARTYGGADNRVIVISGPEGKPLPTRDRVLKILDEVAKSEIDPWQDKAVVSNLMEQPPKPGKIVKEKKLDKIGVYEWTLSNGATVLVKPTDYEQDVATIVGNSPGGLAMASAAMFPHARFADDVVSLGGVGELDGETLAKSLAGKQARASVVIGETLDSVEAEGSVKDLETMFQLVHLRMAAPRADADIVEIWKSNIAEQLENQLRVPEFQFAVQSSEALYKGNARRKPPTPADIRKIDVNKAFAFYKERFGDASDFTFVVVGTFELAKVRPLVETYLASLPSKKGRAEREKDLGIRRVGGVVKKTWALGQEPKARVSLTYHAPFKWTRDAERDMFILSEVLSMRLREVLREDLGGVYGVSASGSVSRLPSQERTFTISFGCDPSRVDELVAAAQAEIARISKNGIPPEYLEKVKVGYKRAREGQLRNNAFWSGWLQSSYRYGDDPAIVLDSKPMLARMTSDHVKASIKKFLDPKQYYQAVMLPAAGSKDPKTGVAPAK